MKAKIELTFPQSNKSGASTNSMQFIVATINICVTAFKRDLKPLNIHTAINISATPIAFVKSTACSLPKILATILSCRGTKFSTLQKSKLQSRLLRLDS